MKKFIAFAAAGLMLVGCQNEELTVDNNGSLPSMENQAITFSARDVKATRGTTIDGEKAAGLLGNNFIVYGFKYGNKTEGADKELADGTSDQVVFDLYNVNYESESANYTQSNTNNWEYAGFTPAKGSAATSQSIKYWDYNVGGYVFSAVSGLDITAKKITSASKVVKKGWTVTVPGGGSLAGLYASERAAIQNEWTKKNATFRYTNPVSLTFYAMASKVRFAIYETVPGYSVKIDRFYYTAATKAGCKFSPTNFVVDGDFYVLGDNDATATITYYSGDEETQGIGIKNHPKVEWKGGTQKTALQFGANMQAETAIGTASNTATYDQVGGEYTYILPYKKADNKLVLKVDYTLTSTDGSNEKIYVHGATATVPANYTQWKENFAYTYIFKITDKANGSTIPYDPGNPDDPNPDPYDPYDPTDENPEGLSPITFDACVVTEEDGVQETVTTLGEPAINTYQQGVVVTANDEYVSGDDIYFSATQMKNLMNLSAAAKVYEVYNLASAGPITEGIVANFETNKVVLVPVTVSGALQVPMKDGSKLDFAANNCYKFTPKVGKTYAIQVNYGTNKYAYKVVKVAGAAADPVFSLTTTTKKIQEGVDSALCELTCDGTGVEGALKNLKVVNAAGEDVTDKFTVAEHKDKGGKYIFKLTDDAISAGADGTYTVKFSEDKASSDYSVDLHYVLRQVGKLAQIPNNTIEIIKGDSAQFRISIYLQNKKFIKADIESENSGIVVKETAKVGTYQVNVSDTVTFKPAGYKVKVAGLELIVKVKSYYFMPWDEESKMIWQEGEPAPTDTIYLYYNAQDTVGTFGITITSSNPDVVEGGVTVKSPVSGMFVSKAKKGGEAVLSVYHLKRTVTVNKYELTTNKNTIKKSTGNTQLTLNVNDEPVVISTANILVSKWDGSKFVALGVDAGYKITNPNQDSKSFYFNTVTATGKYLIEYYQKGRSGKRLGLEYIEVTD